MGLFYILLSTLIYNPLSFVFYFPSLKLLFVEVAPGLAALFFLRVPFRFWLHAVENRFRPLYVCLLAHQGFYSLFIFLQ